MYKCEREDEIMALLGSTEYATVEYLVKKINISASSIRRDLKNLEERGLVIRSYGGVKLAEATGKHIPFSLRSHENSVQKKQMAKVALKLLHPGETVFLDGSSSAYFVSELLPALGGVTVITNSIDVMSLLSRYDIKAYCTGGVISGDNRAVLVGGYTQEFLQKLRADAALFSVQGIHADGSFFDCYAEEVAVRNLMMKNAKRKILLCDSSKWGRASTFYQGNIADIDYLVTDRDPAPFFVEPTPKKYVIA
ncbi:MAG: DeoR/GlpR transcriptional regulator [Ruminococcaceae bacterium]|nr:DeoR/GlpR transcriptional regulator [Oscillospiraceae bacterium]